MYFGSCVFRKKWLFITRFLLLDFCSCYLLCKPEQNLFVLEIIGDSGTVEVNASGISGEKCKFFIVNVRFIPLQFEIHNIESFKLYGMFFHILFSKQE
jgi:hypothetical protein